VEGRAFYLAIDQGGHASRAIVFDSQGVVVGQARVPLFARQPNPAWVEYDPEALIVATRQAINNVITQLGDRANLICAAGLVTQRSNIACWNAHTGEALSPIISWQDLRNASWIDQFVDKRDFIHQRSGLFANGHYGVSKLRWCADHLLEVIEAQQEGSLSWGPMASYLLYSLVREQPLLVDPANASRSLLFNIHQLQWDDALASCFSVSLESLPKVMPSAYCYGHLDLVGFDIPLMVLNGDQSSALFAQGWPDPKVHYINMGTGAFVQRVISEPVARASRLLNSVVWQERDKALYVLEGTVNGAGCAVTEMAEKLGLSSSQMQRVEQWLTDADEVPLFINGVSGIGSPYWRSDVESGFIGDGLSWQKMVAVLESILFLLCDNLREMDGYLLPGEIIQISGGLAQLDGLCQRLADLSGLVVQRPAQCEASAQGIAFLLAQPSGEWGAGLAKRFKPNNSVKLKARYLRWQVELLSRLDLRT